jgi:hypothetical protein
MGSPQEVMTYSVAIEDAEHRRTVTILFDNEQQAQYSETDYYDDCRPKIQAWLNKHYPGEMIATDGEDIEASGQPADNDEVVDMRT